MVLGIAFSFMASFTERPYMIFRSSPRLASLLLAGAALLLSGLKLDAQTNWVGTWATSPMGNTNKGDFLTADTTLRQTVHVSLGGSSVRVVFTNEFGVNPLQINGAQVSLAGNSTGTSAQGASLPLTFGGAPGISIPPGAMVISDAAAH